MSPISSARRPNRSVFHERSPISRKLQVRYRSSTSSASLLVDRQLIKPTSAGLLGTYLRLTVSDPCTSGTYPVSGHLTPQNPAVRR